MDRPHNPDQMPLTRSEKKGKKPTYTTAGTVWNPRPLQALQPPARRGRATKWALRNQTAESLALPTLPRPDPIGPSGKLSAPRRGMTVHPPVATPLYSPLQQNYDRAISPDRMQALQQRHLQEDMDFLKAAESSKPPIDQNYRRRAQLSMSLEKYGALGTAGRGGNGGRDVTDPLEDPVMRKLGVKGLSSLASYANPMQHRAQQALRRAQMVSGSQCSGPSTPALASMPSCIQNIDLEVGGVASAAQDISYDPGQWAKNSSRATRLFSDANHIGNYFPSTTAPLARAQSFQQTMQGDENFVPPQGQKETPSEFGSNPFSPTVLATGPGAPEPLKAGPPGQRQYNFSSFGAALGEIKGQESPQHTDAFSRYEAAQLRLARHHSVPKDRTGDPTRRSEIYWREYLEQPSSVDDSTGWYAHCGPTSDIHPDTNSGSVPSLYRSTTLSEAYRLFGDVHADRTVLSSSSQNQSPETSKSSCGVKLPQLNSLPSMARSTRSEDASLYMKETKSPSPIDLGASRRKSVTQENMAPSSTIPSRGPRDHPAGEDQAHSHLFGGDYSPVYGQPYPNTSCSEETPLSYHANYGVGPGVPYPPPVPEGGTSLGPINPFAHQPVDPPKDEPSTCEGGEHRNEPTNKVHKAKSANDEYSGWRKDQNHGGPMENATTTRGVRYSSEETAGAQGQNFRDGNAHTNVAEYGGDMANEATPPILDVTRPNNPGNTTSYQKPHQHAEQNREARGSKWEPACAEEHVEYQIPHGIPYGTPYNLGDATSGRMRERSSLSFQPREPRQPWNGYVHPLYRDFKKNRHKAGEGDTVSSSVGGWQGTQGGLRVPPGGPPPGISPPPGLVLPDNAKNDGRNYGPDRDAFGYLVPTPGSSDDGPVQGKRRADWTKVDWAEYNRRLDEAWYSGTRRLGDAMAVSEASEAGGGRTLIEKRGSKFGAVSDGRPKAPTAGKAEYAQLSIEEAKKMSVSQHAGPLLHMALESVVGYRERAKEFGWTPWVDPAECYPKLGSAALLPGSTPDED